MNENGNRIIAFDGHDGSGKTSLSKMFSEKSNAMYIRPFGGDTGMQLLSLAEKKDYEAVLTFGFSTIQDCYDKCKDETLVFDRHWMTVFSLIPETYFHVLDSWKPLPETFLCYADLDTTLIRLRKRTEEAFSKEYHQHYLDIYKKLGLQYNATIIRTDQHSLTDCLNQITEFTK
jgi:thymidylate kinase